LFELASKNNYKIDIVTGGVAIDAEHKELLKEYRPILREVNITLDGPKDVHNALRPLKSGIPSYNLIARNIEYLLRENINVLLKQNVGSANVDRIGEFINDIEQRGWYDFENLVHGVNRVQNYGNVDDNGQNVSETRMLFALSEALKNRPERIYKKFRVEGLKFIEYLAASLGVLPGKLDAYPRYAFCHPNDGTTVNISYDGRIHSCNWFVGTDSDFGNIDMADFKRLFDEHNVSVVENSNCQDCDVSTTCGGGCLYDQQINGKGQYFLACQDKVYSEQQQFLREAKNRGHIPIPENNIQIISNGFDLNYTYQSRI